jgi:hypothetical protein
MWGPRALGGLGLVSIVGAALALWLPVGASGAHRYDACPKQTVCVFADVNLVGEKVKLTKPGVSNKLAVKMNNQASSVVNDRAKAVFLFDKKDGKGVSICIGPHSYVEDLEDREFNDVASSSKLTKRDHCPGGPV